MELVDRLKQFLSVNSVPVTQFADNCNIPRPTVSQILNGRNKKISDEIISKIHNAYPQLSVYWLMFGEGNMLTTDNNELKNNNLLQNNLFSQDTISPSESHISSPPTVDTVISDSQKDMAVKNSQVAAEDRTGGGKKNETASSASSATFVINTDSKRCVEKIVVFYNDNSFESFGPSKL